MYDKLRDRPRPRVNRLFKATNILLSIYIEPHIYIIRYDLNPSSLPIPMGETPPLFYNTAQNVTLIRYPLELVQPQATHLYLPAVQACLNIPICWLWIVKVKLINHKNRKGEIKQIVRACC